MRDAYSFRRVRRYPSEPWSVAKNRDAATSGFISDTSAITSTDDFNTLPPYDSETTPPQSLQRPQRTTKSRKVANVWVVNRKRRPRGTSGRFKPLSSLGSTQIAGVMGTPTSVQPKIKKVVLRLNGSEPRPGNASTSSRENTTKWWLKPLHFKPDPFGGSGTLVIRPKLLWNKNITRRQARLKGLTVKGTDLSLETPPTADTLPRIMPTRNIPSIQPNHPPIAPELSSSSKPLRTSPRRPSQPSIPLGSSQKTTAAPARQVTFAPTPHVMVPPVEVQSQNGRRKGRSDPRAAISAQPDMSLRLPRPAVSASENTTGALKGSNQPMVRVNPEAEPVLMTLTLRHLNTHIRERAGRGLGGLKR